MTASNPLKQAVAIIGMGCIFPGSDSLKSFWQLLFNGVDAIRDIPEETHWRLRDYFDPDPSTPDHTYCKRGGFIDPVSFNPMAYGMPPNNIQATDTSQLVSLEVARTALEDAGYPVGHPFLEQHRVNVILGVTGTQELVIPLGARLGHPMWKKALKQAGIAKDKIEQIVDDIQKQYVPWQENSFPGLLGNVIAGRIANRLNLSGTNSASDAACASSLAAMHTAILELAAGRCDMSITGGADTLNDIFMHMCFSKTGVLSHTSDARPFSKDADGTVLGEGVGLVVLKRLEDARRDKDRIYAVIRSIGTSSDGRTSAVYAPESGGQHKALTQAYELAHVDPATVNLIEAHGTGTRVGDKVEFDALKQCFDPIRPKNSTAIGSVKSMIGHTKAAAGAAGVIKSALALYHKVLPPTLKAREPDPELGINESAFFLNDQPRPWLSSSLSHPRRSGVSAFGFGGSNFHMVLEEDDPSKNQVSWDGSVQILAFSADQKDALAEPIKRLRSALKTASDSRQTAQVLAWHAGESRRNFKHTDLHRLTLVVRKHDDIPERLDQALTCIQDSSSGLGIYFSSQPAKGRIGFLFPGQGSQYSQMGKELLCVFPEALEVMENACRIFAANYPEADPSGPSGLPKDALSDCLFPPPAHLQSKRESESKLQKTDLAQPAIGAVSLAMAKVLSRFGVSASITCGHSFGELTALCAAGWMEESSFLDLAVKRGRHMAAAGDQEADPGSMLAVQAPLDTIRNIMDKNGLDLVLANLNSPTQGVLSGATEEIVNAGKIFKAEKIRAVQLPVAAAFHSRLVEKAARPFARDVEQVSFSATDTDVLSNTTGAVYERSQERICALLGRQLAKPVRFVDNVRTMVDDGISVLIEVGPKAVLSGLAQSILKQSGIRIMSLDNPSQKRSSIENLAHTLSELASLGFKLDLTQWEDPVEKPEFGKMSVLITGANVKPVVPEPGHEPVKMTSESVYRPPVPETDVNVTPSDIPTPKSVKGSGMTTNRPAPDNIYSAPVDTTANASASLSMQTIQQGLEAMRQLQEQTSRAHEKFLDTQAQAVQALSNMMGRSHGMPLQQAPAMAPPAPVYQPAPAAYAPTREYQGQPVSGQIETIQPPAMTSLSQAPSSSASVSSPVQAPAPAPQTPVAAVTSSAPPSSDTAETTDDTEPVLFDIVSRLTGFPMEMLEAGMDIESDLGIDSIKKVEIISELEKQIPSCQGLTSEHIGSVRTLEDICRAVSGASGSSLSDHQVQGAGSDSREASSLQTTTEPSAESNNTVLTSLMKIISELTGFPKDMLEPSMHLESDLGIDSIKRVEILSKLEQEVEGGTSISSEDMAGLKTIEQIVQSLSGGGSQTPPAQQVSQPAAKRDQKKNAAPRKSDSPLTRQVVSLKTSPTHQIRFYNGSRIQLPADKTVYLTRDHAGISECFQQEFVKIGIRAKLIDLNDGNSIPDLPDAAGLVLVADAFSSDDSDTATRFMVSAFELLKQNAFHLSRSSPEKGAFLASVTFLGGSFGFSNLSLDSNPVFGGLAGLIKTAGIEFKDILCRALDLSYDVDICRQSAEAAVSLMLTSGEVEMGLDQENCHIPVLEERVVKKGAVRIMETDVVVVSGGARGVTGACALEIAQAFSPVMILLGRSATPPEEPDWVKGLEDAGALKKAILDHGLAGEKPRPADLEREYRKIISGREIAGNMAAMTAAGAKVQYISLDVTDKDNVAAVLSRVQEDFGPVRVLVHGAGVVADKHIVEKSTDAFKRVFETKVKGLDALLSAVQPDELKHLILFSSVAARSGNQGQCDYAMANEVLNKTAQVFAARHEDCRVLSLNWGPWDGGMVDDGLKKEFERRGVSLIPLKAGARQMIEEMGAEVQEGPEIVIGGHVQPPARQPSIQLAKAGSILVSEKAMPILSSHCIGNEPVLPFALLMEIHAVMAEKNNPGLMVTGLDDMRLLKGVRPGDGSIELSVNMARCRPVEKGVSAPGTIVSLKNGEPLHTHSSCTLMLDDKRPDPPVLPESAFMELKPYNKSMAEVYDKILFHGSGLQCITSVNGCSRKGIEVMARSNARPEDWLEKPAAPRWVIDPMIMDAAFQSAIIWCSEIKGQVCLPSFIGSLRLYSSYDSMSEKNVRIILTVNEVSAHMVKGYFTFLDESGTVIASITGFEAVCDPSLAEKFKNEPLFSRESILAFANGNPSEAFGEKYKVFDQERQIARLPQPPYFFMDQVRKADHPQWEMTPGGFIESRYEIPADEWYFKANHTDGIPFCILLEIALQPCGWLAAYAGSALHSSERLHFRNLGGKATLLHPVTRHSGMLSVRCRMSEVSKAGDMIVQDFELDVRCRGQVMYQGTTNFGFFTRQALANQVGVRNSALAGYELPDDLMKSAETSILLPPHAPLDPEDPVESDAPEELDGMPAAALKMIDRIDLISFEGGIHQNGYIQASKQINPDEWFFRAHFYQDPVCPGSLGIESFLQLLRFFLLKKYNIDSSAFEPVLSPGYSHEWIYRGQIIPSNRKVVVQAHIRNVQNENNEFSVSADGCLSVDGICIYEMKAFRLAFVPSLKLRPDADHTSTPRRIHPGA